MKKETNKQTKHVLCGVVLIKNWFIWSWLLHQENCISEIACFALNIVHNYLAVYIEPNGYWIMHKANRLWIGEPSICQFNPTGDYSIYDISIYEYWSHQDNVIKICVCVNIWKINIWYAIRSPWALWLMSLVK